jgi:hypothetical protein
MRSIWRAKNSGVRQIRYGCHWLMRGWQKCEKALHSVNDLAKKQIENNVKEVTA